jgi:hypothetical protein
MTYKYTIKIHTVVDYSELENIMNDYGRDKFRVTKSEFIGDVFENNRPMKKFVVYLEKKVKK